MALNFPGSPNLNDTYSYGDKTWIWNGSAWDLASSGAINNVPIGNVTPSSGAFTTLSATGTFTGTTVEAATIGNAGASIIGDGSALTSLTGGNVSGTVANATYALEAGNSNTANSAITSGTANQVIDATQSNITAVGTLTGLTLSGTLTGTTLNAAIVGNAGAALIGATLNTSGTATVNDLTSNGAVTVNGTVVIDSGSEVVTAQLKDSGISAGTYGDASNIAQIVVDAKGRVTSAVNVAVAGVSDVSYVSANSNLTISTSSGTNYSVDLGVGTEDTPQFAGLTLTGTLTGTTLEAATIGNAGASLIGDGSGLTSLTGANISGTVANATYATEASNSNTANTAITAGTANQVIDATQSNITAVGTLTGLTLSGTLTGTTINAATIGNSGASIVGTLTGSATSAGTAQYVTEATQSNITAVGTLTALTVSGTLISQSINAAIIGNAGAALVGNLSGSATTAGTAQYVTEASQGNITSVGTLTGLTLSGTLTGTTVEAAQIGNTGATLTGTLSTAAQTNITSVGTLTGLTLSGTLTGTTINAASIGNTGAALTGTLQTAAQPNIDTLADSVTIGEITIGSNSITSTHSVITIDPASAGQNGLVVIEGNLQVTGNVTYVDSGSIVVNDKDIIVANNQTTSAGIDGAGILAGNIGGVGIATWVYNHATTSWQSNVGVTPAGNASLSLGGTSNYWSTGYFNAIEAPSITGVLQTAAQTNITSVGTLTGLTLSGTLTGTTINAATIGNSGAALTGATLNTSGNSTVNAITINNSATVGTTLGVTGNVTANSFIIAGDGVFYSNGDPYSSGGGTVAESGGFVESTVVTAPGTNGNYDLARPTNQSDPPETPFETGGTDAFGVSLGIIYDDMEPIGRYVTLDYGDGEAYVGA